MRNLEQFGGTTGKTGDKNYLQGAIREQFEGKGENALNEKRRKDLLEKINKELDRIRGMVDESKTNKEKFVGSLDMKKSNMTTLMVGVLVGGLCVYLFLNRHKVLKLLRLK
tara:strand:- start:209 stop:541 length:333 start_codon:yes stop_codon:yes gene_type:complete